VKYARFRHATAGLLQPPPIPLVERPMQPCRLTFQPRRISVHDARAPLFFPSVEKKLIGRQDCRFDNELLSVEVAQTTSGHHIDAIVNSAALVS
jgi:hypothetical protein